MNIDYAFMKESYKCIKGTTCDVCTVKGTQIVFGSGRAVNNKIFFCSAPELKVEKVSQAWKKSKAAAAAK